MGVIRMFLYEKELKESFWKSYNNRGRAKRWQFECEVREVNADLITIEKYQNNWQINAFEFKLSDLKKAFLQAEANIPFCNKSWIVVPIERKELILSRYINYLNEKKIYWCNRCRSRRTIRNHLPTKIFSSKYNI